MNLFLLTSIIVEISLSQSSATTLNKVNICPCGWRNKEVGKIIGGEESSEQEWPMMAGVLLRNSRKHVCGGSIVTRRHILTAGHCLYDRRGNRLRMDNIGIIVGAHNYTKVKDEDVLPVFDIIFHPEYIYGETSPDLALLAVTNIFFDHKSLGPVCLPTRTVNPVGKRLRHMGWGVTYWKGQNISGSSEVLKTTILKAVPLKHCQYGDLINWKTPFQLCTRQRETSQCLGDSGGPLMWLDSATNRYSLIAVVSFARNECTKGPAVSTEIIQFIPWLEEAVRVTSNYDHLCFNVKT